MRSRESMALIRAVEGEQGADSCDRGGGVQQVDNKR